MVHHIGAHSDDLFLTPEFKKDSWPFIQVKLRIIFWKLDKALKLRQDENTHLNNLFFSKSLFYQFLKIAQKINQEWLF